MYNILLLEPNYQAKYPPLGLMKIAYYHNHITKDAQIFFAKGSLPVEDKCNSIIWDRIYVSTLFTYEWVETINAIKYAKQLLQGDISKLIVGGSAATLMSVEIEEETSVKPVTGLLNEPYKIGYKDDYIIDNLPPDYSILDQINYKYPYENSYFAFTTRGCGMNCSFCAVKKLEPTYIDYIPIVNQINMVRKNDQLNGKAGELRQNLLLLDNNVLKSTRLKDIITDIEILGFGKGSTFINQLSGKSNKRHVDFNQGLDANLLTEEKAKLLGRLALKPVRIAFDHIEDKAVYESAIKNCYKNGLKEFSNYVLYNTDQTTGKGHKYNADKPEDLYNRLKITMDIKECINSYADSNNHINIYSFPMKYIPLNSKSRYYIGLNWNKKFLRTIQIMLTPTQGKGVSGKAFFEASFGRSESEFKMFLYMPESLLAGRGKIINNSIDPILALEKKRSKTIQNKCYREWTRLFHNINNKEDILEIIKDNCFTSEQFFLIKSTNIKLLYLYYLSPTQLLNLLASIEKEEDKKLIIDYFTTYADFYLKKVIAQAIAANYSFSQLSGVVNIFKMSGFIMLIQIWVERKCVDNEFPDNLHHLYIHTNSPRLIEPKLLDILKHFVTLNILTDEDINHINKYIGDQDILAFKTLLKDKLPLLHAELENKLLTEKAGLDILRARLKAIVQNIEDTLVIKEDK